jgi:MFS transporter, DHA1 family, inner membrane transport protein
VVLVGVLLAADRAAHAKVPAALTLFLLGVIGFATVPAFTSRVIGTASADANILASSAAVAAFNLGNATGAYLGGRAIAAGHGYASPNLVGAAMAACALALALGSAAIGRRCGCRRRGRERDRAVSPVPGPGPPRP